jgi:PAS domain S-box-containing protein
VTRSLPDLPGLTVGAEDLLATVVETVAQPIWIVGPDDVIRFANAAAIAALGYEGAGELVGRRGQDTIHDRHPDGTPRSAAESPTRLPREAGQTVARDTDWFHRRDGSMLPVSYVASPIAMPAGRGAVIAFTDIGDRLRDTRIRGQDEAFLAAHRRVAALASGGAASAEVFAAIAREVGHVMGLPRIVLWRFDAHRAAVVEGAWSRRPHPFEPGTCWPLDGPAICATVLDTGRPARIEDLAGPSGTIATAARETGARACAGAPIVVDGEVWGVLSADLADPGPLTAPIEDRLAEFAELVATAIWHTASRDQLARLADEQAALRRVATLAASESPPAEVFAAVATEVSELIGVHDAAMFRYEDETMLTVVANANGRDPPVPVGETRSLDGENLAGRVHRTGRPARIEDYEQLEGPLAADARARGIRCGAGAPILVHGRLWGVVVVGLPELGLPAGAEDRIAAFAQLIAAAVSNTEAQEQLARLAEEQAALRRVATLVAEGVPPPEVFAAVAREVGQLLRVEWTHMARYEPDGTSMGVAGWSPAGDAIPVGTRVDLDSDSVGGLVLRTGRPARMRHYEHASGQAAALGRERGLHSSVGAPIVVDRRLWGVMMAASKGDRPLPDDTESRITAFTELVATAISNTEARAQVARLADEQAALRRVATLVARAVPPNELFGAVTEEAGALLHADLAALTRYETHDTLTVLATWAATRDHPELGPRIPVDGGDLASRVLRTGRPARLDAHDGGRGPHAMDRERLGIRSSVAAPILVEGRIWGGLVVHSRQLEPLPEDTEARLSSFTELVATAIANAESSAALAASRARIVVAADDSRRRIERDLHDGTQQRLVSLMLELRMMEGTEGPEAAELRRQLARTAQGLEGVLEELREISRGIHPAILSEGGLGPALRGLARRSAVPVELDLRGARRLPEPIEVAAYYVVSETLSNAAKHANASVVHVELDAEGETLRVAIRDDGVGGADPKQGSGLVGLSDRIDALGGTLRVSSPPGTGTTVLIEVPVERGARAGSPGP